MAQELVATEVYVECRRGLAVMMLTQKVSTLDVEGTLFASAIVEKAMTDADQGQLEALAQQKAGSSIVS